MLLKNNNGEIINVTSVVNSNNVNTPLKHDTNKKKVESSQVIGNKIENINSFANLTSIVKSINNSGVTKIT